MKKIKSTYYFDLVKINDENEYGMGLFLGNKKNSWGLCKWIPLDKWNINIKQKWESEMKAFGHSFREEK